MITQKFKNYGHLGLCLLLFLTAVIFRFCFEFHQFDDAYVSFRYAHNLLAGKGFVYNEGRRVLGTTTPLFTLLLALAGFIFRTDNMPRLANTISHLADGGTAVLLYLIGLRLWGMRNAECGMRNAECRSAGVPPAFPNAEREVGSEQPQGRHHGQTALAFVMALFFVFSFHSVFYSSSGMETSFFSFLLLFSLERMLNGRRRAALALAAAALMTRPDALLLAPVLGGLLLLDRRAFRLAEALPAAGMVLAYVAFLLLYFGSVVPQSMVAKGLIWGTLDKSSILGFPSYYEVMMFWSGFLSKSHSKDMLPNVLRLIPIVPLFALGLVEIGRRDRRLLAVPALGLVFFLAYAKSTMLVFPWYLIPTVPALVLTVFAGFKLLIEKGLAAVRLRSAGAVAAAGVLFLASQTMVFVGAKADVPSAIHRVMYPTHTEPLYRKALAQMRPLNPPFTIMAPEIGFIGYYCPQATIIDPVGLTNPEVTTFYKEHRDKHPRDLQFVSRAFLEEFSPDVIITVPAFVSPGLTGEPAFKSKYAAATVSPAPGAECPESILLFQKRPNVK